MYEFSYDYLKSKYGENVNFVIWIQTASLFMWKWITFTKTLQKMLERFNTSNYEIDRPFPKEKNKNVIEQVKNELGGQIMK